MTDEKLSEWLDLYEQTLGELNNYNPHIVHMRGMIPKMRVLLAEGRREKLMRWIGFIQGACWHMGIFSIEELKEHNRPSLEPPVARE